MPVIEGPAHWQRHERALQNGGEPPYDGGMDTANFVTKADLAGLRADFAEWRGDLKASIAELRADIHKTDSQHKTWILATVLSVIGTGIAMAALIITNLKQPPQPVQAANQPPIIVNVPAPQAQTPAPATNQRR